MIICERKKVATFMLFLNLFEEKPAFSIYDDKNNPYDA